MIWTEAYYVAFAGMKPVAYGTVYRCGHERPQRAIAGQAKAMAKHGVTAMYLFDTFTQAERTYYAHKIPRARGRVSGHDENAGF